jgi:hypothetical protein
MLGELFHRMSRTREYPSRIMTSDCTSLVACLQPGVMRVDEPTAAFPPAGLYKGGRYYEVEGVKGNLVNVRSDSSLCMW